jgi:XTP/dITP diphosphohydrolase
MRRFEGGKLIVASHNKGKAREIAELLAAFPVEVISAASLGLPEPEETGLTFIANAELKARAAADTAKLPALADDSGMSVEGLNGAPGIYSARWAGPTKDFALAMKRVQDELGPNPNRRASFNCALSLAWPDGEIATFEGKLEGTLVYPPRGTKGFGYDPMFIPDGYDRTFGEIDHETKQRISHRALAFKKLVTNCFR